MTTCFFSRQTQYNLSDQSAGVAPDTELQSPATRNTVLKSLNEPQICLKKHTQLHHLQIMYTGDPQYLRKHKPFLKTLSRKNHTPHIS